MSVKEIYLARYLHLPAGEVLERYVVIARDGKVLEWHPFESETHSMLLVDDLYLAETADGAVLLADSAS